MKRIVNILLLAATLLAASCDYKDLCYHHPHTATIDIRVDWSQSRYNEFDDRQLPTGMTVVAYSREGQKPVIASTNDIEHITLNLIAGAYDVVLFNQSFAEFGSLSFEQTEHFADLCASSVINRVAWVERSNPDGFMSRPPEWLAVARVEDLVVTKEMTTVRGRAAEQVVTAALEKDVLIFRPRSATKKGTLTVHVNGYQNLASLRAVVQGYAKGYYMGTNIYTDLSTGYQMGGWQALPDAADRTKGTIVAEYQSFGLPSDFTGRPEEMNVYMECLLVDGETIEKFSFDVGNRIREIMSEVNGAPYVDYAIDIEITLPDVKPQGASSGGFTVKVDDWDDEVVISVPIE